MEVSIDPESLEYTPPNYFVPLVLSDIFEREAPLHMDVGCGEGAFIVAMAKANPQCNFLGVERLVGRVRKVCKRAVNAGVGNVRVVCVESFYTMSKLMPPQSVSVVHVMFPDPWPKRKHRQH